jgi:hypothetical protein
MPFIPAKHNNPSRQGPNEGPKVPPTRVLTYNPMDAPRLLHRRSEYAYTSDPTRALTDAGEAIPATTQAELTARAHRTHRQTQLDEWDDRRQAIQREIDWLHSQRFQRDVRSALRALQRQVDRLDASLR